MYSNDRKRSENKGRRENESEHMEMNTVVEEGRMKEEQKKKTKKNGNGYFLSV